MILWFAIALIGFLGLAVVYLGLSDRKRRRCGKTTKGKQASAPLSDLSKGKKHCMEIVGMPLTDLSIYYSPKKVPSKNRDKASRRKVERLMLDNIGVSLESSPLDSASESVSESDISTDELDRVATSSESEQKLWCTSKLNGVNFTAVYKDKSLKVQEAINQLMSIPPATSSDSPTPPSEFL